MASNFSEYKSRRIRFEKIAEIGEWKVKVYTITQGKQFKSRVILENAVNKLPEWLEISNKLESPTYGIATLIVHEGRDGVWSLVNWWTGGEMLQNLTFYTDTKVPEEFVMYPETGSMACVWEMSVILHEREAWIKHILKNSESPRFDNYLNDRIEGLV